jgi:hypothetical protein
MPVERICCALRGWLYRRLCYPEQQEILVLLDRVVQDAQGVLLQLESVCETIPPNLPAKEDLGAALKRAEGLLEQLRNQADIRTQRMRARTKGSP